MIVEFTPIWPIKLFIKPPFRQLLSANTFLVLPIYYSLICHFGQCCGGRLIAGLSLHIFTTEIVERKDHEKLITNQNNWIFDNLQQLVTINLNRD